MSEKTHWKKLQDNNYVGEYMFDGTAKDIVVTIKNVKQEEVFEPNSNTTSIERVLEFVEIPQKMICNTTNAKRIEKLYDSPFIEDWIGKKISLFFDKNVKFGRELVGGIRVRTTAPTSSAPICQDCGCEISGDSGKSAEWVAQYTQKKYGRPLCAKCATAIANK